MTRDPMPAEPSPTEDTCAKCGAKMLVSHTSEDDLLRWLSCSDPECGYQRMVRLDGTILLDAVAVSDSTKTIPQESEAPKADEAPPLEKRHDAVIKVCPPQKRKLPRFTAKEIRAVKAAARRWERAEAEKVADSPEANPSRKPREDESVTAVKAQEPKYEEYGFDEKDVEKRESLAHKLAATVALACIVGLALFDGSWFSLFYSVPFVGPFVYLFSFLLFMSVLRPAGFKKWEKDHRCWEEKVREAARRSQMFWLSLSGYAFEHALADLYKRLGYEVGRTGGSGDQGVDIELSKNGKKTVVQCKAHKNPLSPATVRELLGTKLASGADRAVLATFHGVTRGAREFADKNGIEVLDVRDIVSMEEGAQK